MKEVDGRMEIGCSCQKLRAPPFAALTDAALRDILQRHEHRLQITPALVSRAIAMMRMEEGDASVP